MSNLIAVAYPDRGTAEQVRAELVEAAREHLLRLEDAVIVHREGDGKIKLDQAVSTAKVGAAGGAMWGGVIGLLFFAPLLGMAVGAASGALGGKLSDVGVDDGFMKELGTKLEPGGTALIFLGEASARDKVLERVGPYGGEVIQTSLSNDLEEQLKTALAAPAGASA